MSVFLLFAFVFAVCWLNTKESKELPVQVRDAIETLVQQEVCVSMNGYHLYKSQRSKESPFVILHFDSNANLKSNDEESFSEIGEAIKKFAVNTGLVKV